MLLLNKTFIERLDKQRRCFLWHEKQGKEGVLYGAVV
jgi:hypothetical protein